MGIKKQCIGAVIVTSLINNMFGGIYVGHSRDDHTSCLFSSLHPYSPPVR